MQSCSHLCFGTIPPSWCFYWKPSNCKHTHPTPKTPPDREDTTTSDLELCTLRLSGTTVGGPPAADRRAKESQRANSLKSLVVVNLSDKPKNEFAHAMQRRGTLGKLINR